MTASGYALLTCEKRQHCSGGDHGQQRRSKALRYQDLAPEPHLDGVARILRLCSDRRRARLVAHPTKLQPSPVGVSPFAGY